MIQKPDKFYVLFNKNTIIYKCLINFSKNGQFIEGKRELALLICFQSDKNRYCKTYAMYMYKVQSNTSGKYWLETA